MKEQYYSIAIRKKIGVDDRFWKQEKFRFQEIKIINGSKYWFADPFIFEHKGAVYLFYEAYDTILGKGVIAYSILKKNNTATPPRVIIEEKYHLSFPFIFQDGGDIFIMPECCGNNTISLYRALNFPNQWEKHKVISDNCFCSDNVLVSYAGQKYLSTFQQFRNPPMGKKHYCWGSHTLYSLDLDFNITNTISSQMVGDYGIRNAGAFDANQDGLFRVGQDCTNGIYGRGIVLFRVKNLNPYLEKEVYAIDFAQMQNHINFIGSKIIDGSHTYNISDHYEVIDFSYLRDVPLFIRINRSVRYRLSKLRRNNRGK